MYYKKVTESKYPPCIQISGLGMGNPLASILANLYMEFYERDILPMIDLPIQIKWDRYVDDIIVPFEINTDIESVLNKLNNLVPSIKFTLESENNCTLPFLDK